MNRRLGKDALKLTIAQIITMALSMLSVMLLSRFRSLEEYGTYSQLMLVTSLLLSIGMMGIPNCLNYFLARSETYEDRRHFLSQYYTSITTLSIIVGVVLLVSEPIIENYFNNGQIINYWFFLLIYPWSSAIIGTLDYFLVFYNKTETLVKYKIGNGVSLLTIIIIVQRFNFTFNAYMVMFVLVESFFALSTYLIVYKNCGKLQFLFDRNLLKNMLHFSIPLGMSAIIGTLSIELDKLLIGKFYSTQELAVYTNAAKEMPVTIIATSISAVLIPAMAIYMKERKYKEAISAWGQATTLSYSFICFFTSILIVFAPEIITILYSEKYLEGLTIFRIYSLLILLRCTTFGMMLNALGETKIIMKFSVFSLCLDVILNVILFILVGFNGPAIATLLATLVLAISQLVLTAKKLDFPFKSIMPWIELGKITVLNAALGTVFYVLVRKTGISSFIENDLIKIIFWGGIWSIIYLLIMQKKVKLQWTLLNSH